MLHTPIYFKFSIQKINDLGRSDFDIIEIYTLRHDFRYSFKEIIHWNENLAQESLGNMVS